MFDTSLLRLLQLADPTIPIGGYAHSNGLETYVQHGIVKDVVTARAFVTEMLSQNIQYTDAAIVSLAFDAAEKKDIGRILELDRECTAIKLPREVRQASQKLGMRLIKIFETFTNCEIAVNYKKAIDRLEANGHYPVVFGIYASELKIAKADALAGFYYNAAAGMVTNSVKLIPLGQLDGQGILFSLQSLIGDLVQSSLSPQIDLIGLCCSGFDIRCMQHEELYSRLYMS